MELEGWAFIRGLGSENSQIYVVLKSESRTYVFDTITIPHKGAGFIDAFRETGLNLDDSGFWAIIPLGKVKSGQYLIGIYMKKGDTEALGYIDAALVKSKEAVNLIRLGLGPAGETPSHEPYLWEPSPRLTVTASSFNQYHESEKSLVDDNGDTYWHVANPPQSSVHWVSFDFGEPVTVTGLALLPRNSYVDQLWNQANAVFQGSNEPTKDGWVAIARLFVDKEEVALKGWDWLRYNLPGSSAYRYYRLLIDDPQFLSLAEIKFRR
ncbi:MAG: discoidin domain-containing protein [Chloroflexota bacterium]